MDIEKTTEHVRLKFDHAVQKKIIRERMQEKMLIAHDGGLFKVSPTLMTEIEVLSRFKVSDSGNPGEILSLLIEDINGNPIMIEDYHAFRDKIIEKYHEVMNEWYMEFNRIKRIRKIEDV